MGRHSRRGPAPKSAPKRSSGTSSGTSADPSGVSSAPSGGASSPHSDGARGTSRLPDGTPPYGFPGLPGGTSGPGDSGYPDGTPAHGFPRVRGGHPEQRETGGGWGDLRGRQAGSGQPVIPRQRPMPPQGPRQSPRQGPRQEYLDAFEPDEDTDVFTRAGRPFAPTRASDPFAATAATAGSRSSATGPGAAGRADAAAGDDADDAPPTGAPVDLKGAKGRTFTGIAAAAVTTVLAVVVAGQVTDARDDGRARSQSAAGQAGGALESAAPGPSVSPSQAAVTLTYAQKMGAKYQLGAKLEGSGKFDAIQGIDKAPGKGQKYTYRVDVEQGLGLDGALFAEAVQKTLNDDRSWAHGGARTFERIHSGEPDFVITLASPGTTATWCAKSGLDTTVDNVSCDSAATERVMINAYRWAQGSETYGDAIYAYRQMLINHEVGHRLGHHHVNCEKDGALAPVMQQQTKFLDHDGIHCLPNPWPYPRS
ncbi:DUF3152 domain-containing protein [Streptomyces sp. NPDC001388]|uniref:DUF3152 domain-containing protein n=1 Tax=Streptomyces sp. NPDC001388 TaxID=3364568 RepID=UPI0036B34C9E